ncbi:TRAP transporter small permease [Roseobacter weihaiensis]|uniref:TRAP transporter small permease n=1 Tax=Roseobacter weihaiensis TaxID=2763262 RepID=UPI001D09F817|nr:TRAP transporter small permease subunit [Roseobacter sp. H9]
MTPRPRPVPKAIAVADALLLRIGRVFSRMCAFCLLAMLALTAVTILLRPFDVSFYWIFPWVMVLFVWLSFFGFFPAMIFNRDIRIDFVARLFGDMGMLVTRIVGQVVVLFVLYWLLLELPAIVARQSGSIDGALLPWGGEVKRRLLSLPLLLSCLCITAALLVDIAKMLLGLPERGSDRLPGEVGDA